MLEVLSFIGIALVAGTILGVAWRLGEDWLERRAARQAQQVVMSGSDEQEVVEVPETTPPVNASPTADGGKLN